MTAIAYEQAITSLPRRWIQTEPTTGGGILRGNVQPSTYLGFSDSSHLIILQASFVGCRGHQACQDAIATELQSR